MESLKSDVLRGGDGQDCFVLTLDDETESQEAEEHILQWLTERGLGHLSGVTETLCMSLSAPAN